MNAPAQPHRSELRPLPMRITQLQFERLHNARRVDGMSVQEHIRRGLDMYLDKLERANAQYRAAVEERPDAPDGDASADAVREANNYDLMPAASQAAIARARVRSR